MVRSTNEVIIYNWFLTKKIRVIYEYPIYYKENDDFKSVHPDFYLPDKDLFIDYMGFYSQNELEQKEYTEEKEYTKKICEQCGKKIIMMPREAIHNINAYLSNILEMH